MVHTPSLQSSYGRLTVPLSILIITFIATLIACAILLFPSIASAQEVSLSTPTDQLEANQAEQTDAVIISETAVEVLDSTNEGTPTTIDVSDESKSETTEVNPTSVDISDSSLVSSDNSNIDNEAYSIESNSDDQLATDQIINDTEATSASDTITETVPTNEPPTVGFVYIDLATIVSGQTQSVAVIFDDENLAITDAILYYSSSNNGTTYTAPANYLANGGALFQFSAPDTTDVFSLTSMDVVIDGVTASVSLTSGDGLCSFTVMSSSDDALAASLATANNSIQDETGSDDIVNGVSYTGTSDDSVTQVLGLAESLATATNSVFTLGDDGILTVCLDPGHGGDDSGAVGVNGLLEKNANLSIALYCKAKLESYGIRVVMTRSDDSRPSTVTRQDLLARADTAKNANADIYVSIHNNSVDSPSANGCEIYYPNSTSTWKNRETSLPGKELANAIYQKLTELGLTGRGVLERVIYNAAGEGVDGNGIAYAYPNDPTNVSDYYALIRYPRLYGIPSVVVEHGFVTNYDDAAKLSDPVWLQAMGEADAQAIIDCYHDVLNAGYLGFDDVRNTDWFVTEGTNDGKQGYLDYVVSHGIMTGYTNTDGTSNGLFGPYDPITREQVATILYRIANPSSNSTTNPGSYATKTVFTDTVAGAYYSNAAIQWCYDTKVITGDTDASGNLLYTFRPTDPITREELATMLKRFATYEGASTTADISSSDTTLKAMKDINDPTKDISSFALDGVRWCVANSIITGSVESDGTYLHPQDNTTRAQMAKMITVLMRDVLEVA